MSDPETPPPAPIDSGGTEAVADDLEALTAEPADLDGYSIDQLAEYVDAGRQPVDPAIESSPSCLRAIAALERLRAVSADLLTDEHGAPATDDAWLQGVMDRIALDARSGADFTMTRTEVGDEVVMTEGALRSVVRAAGDEQPGFLVGRVRFNGDLSSPTSPIVFTVDVVVAFGTVIPEGVEGLRAAVRERLRLHTLFRDPRIDVVVRDLTADREDA